MNEGAVKKQFWNDALFFIPYIYIILLLGLKSTFLWRYFGEELLVKSSYVCVGILAVREVFSRRFSLLLGLMCGFLFVLSALKNDLGINVDMIFVFIYCARDIDFKIIAKVSIAALSAVFVATLLCCWFGLIEDQINVNAGRVRHFLGFRYTLFPAVALENIVFMYLIIREDRIKTAELCALLLLCTLVFAATVSRLAYYISCLVILSSFLMKNRKISAFVTESSFMEKVSVCLFPVLFLLCVLTSLAYNVSNPSLFTLNKMLEGRIAMGNKGILDYGISLLGSHIYMIGSGLDEYGMATAGEYFYIDCLYVQLFLELGVAGSAVLSYLVSRSMHRTYKERQPYLLLMLFTFCAHCILDDQMVNLNMCTLWLCMGSSFAQSDRSIPLPVMRRTGTEKAENEKDRDAGNA